MFLKTKYHSLGVSLLANIILFLTPLAAFGFDFAEESGLKETAETTGHEEMEAFTPGGIPEAIGYLISIVLSFVGIIFLLLTIYGGYLWMTAAGNEEQISKAKKIITAAIIGLIIIAGAYTITALIGNYFA